MKSRIALALALLCVGCTSYKGGRVVDGTNLEVGIIVPGTDYSLNLLSYTGGMKVGGNTDTSISVSNEVAETNSYFGVITIRRHTRLTANVEPCEKGDEVK